MLCAVAFSTTISYRASAQISDSSSSLLKSACARCGNGCFVGEWSCSNGTPSATSPCCTTDDGSEPTGTLYCYEGPNQAELTEVPMAVSANSGPDCIPPTLSVPTPVPTPSHIPTPPTPTPGRTVVPPIVTPTSSIVPSSTPAATNTPSKTPTPPTTPSTCCSVDCFQACKSKIVYPSDRGPFINEWGCSSPDQEEDIPDGALGASCCVAVPSTPSGSGTCYCGVDVDGQEIEVAVGCPNLPPPPSTPPTVPPSISPTTTPSISPTAEPSISPTIEPPASPTVEPTPSVSPTPEETPSCGEPVGDLSLSLDPLCPLQDDADNVAMFGNDQSISIPAAATLVARAGGSVDNCSITLSLTQSEDIGGDAEHSCDAGELNCSNTFMSTRPPPPKVHDSDYTVEVRASSPDCCVVAASKTVLIRKTPRKHIWLFHGVNGGEPIPMLSIPPESYERMDQASNDKTVYKQMFDLGTEELLRSSENSRRCQRYRTIGSVGWSNGGHAALYNAARLGERGVRTTLALILDAVPWNQCSIKPWCNFRSPGCIETLQNHFQQVHPRPFIGFGWPKRGRKVDCGGSNKINFVGNEPNICAEKRWPAEAHSEIRCHEEVYSEQQKALDDMDYVREEYFCGPSESTGRILDGCRYSPIPNLGGCFKQPSSCAN